MPFYMLGLHGNHQVLMPERLCVHTETIVPAQKGGSICMENGHMK